MVSAFVLALCIMFLLDSKENESSVSLTPAKIIQQLRKKCDPVRKNSRRPLIFHDALIFNLASTEKMFPDTTRNKSNY